TASQIAAQGSIGFSRVLSEIPGVQITMAEAGATGGAFADEYAVDSPANPIYIGIRGSQPYENATLFDGHRVNSTNWISIANGGGTSGTFNLANLDTNSISSIDVVKGPGADSPTDNNAIGGVANIVPMTPSGKPSAILSYGFDGNGGLQFNLNAQGETRNHRLGLAISSSSYTLPGPIGGWPQFDYLYSPWGITAAIATINGKSVPILPYGFNSNCVGYNYAPHLNGGFSTLGTAPLIGCCYSKFYQDYTLQQNRSFTFLYNVAPAVQLTLRYVLVNTVSDYSNTPLVQMFSPPPGYVGKFENGYTFQTQYENNTPAREIDQTYEWTIHSQLGKGSALLSYLSLESTNISNNSNNAGAAGSAPQCINCMLSGIAILGGTVPTTVTQYTNNITNCGNVNINEYNYTCGTPTILNDQKVTLTQAFNQFTNYYGVLLNHD